MKQSLVKKVNSFITFDLPLEKANITVAFFKEFIKGVRMMILDLEYIGYASKVSRLNIGIHML